jgi:hypothetical protein
MLHHLKGPFRLIILVVNNLVDVVKDTVDGGDGRHAPHFGLVLDS